MYKSVIAPHHITLASNVHDREIPCSRQWHPGPFSNGQQTLNHLWTNPNGRVSLSPVILSPHWLYNSPLFTVMFKSLRSTTALASKVASVSSAYIPRVLEPCLLAQWGPRVNWPSAIFPHSFHLGYSLCSAPAKAFPCHSWILVRRHVEILWHQHPQGCCR